MVISRLISNGFSVWKIIIPAVRFFSRIGLLQTYVSLWNSWSTMRKTIAKYWIEKCDMLMTDAHESSRTHVYAKIWNGIEPPIFSWSLCIVGLLLHHVTSYRAWKRQKSHLQLHKLYKTRDLLNCTKEILLLSQGRRSKRNIFRGGKVSFLDFFPL